MTFTTILRTALAALAITAIGVADAAAQTETPQVRRRTEKEAKTTLQGGVSQRMQTHFETRPVDESELQWMRVMYRQIDLTKDANGALYFPDEPVDGQENLFRIIMRLLASGQLTAYEYLDGREMYTPEYAVKVRDMLDRFHILYTEAKGSTERNPRFVIEEADVPSGEVLTYYVVERWEFDKRQNRMRTKVDAICPVLHRSGDFGGEAVKYPMFWVKYDQLRPHLITQNIFTDDDNNLATCTYDDFFQMGLYDGEIYKTRNLKNQSLMQMHPDPDDLKHAQDSIQHRLDTFEEKLWVPGLDELARRKAEKEGLDTAEATAQAQSEGKPAERRAASRTKRGQKDASPKPVKVKKPKSPKSSSASSSAPGRSVRNRKR